MQTLGPCKAAHDIDTRDKEAHEFFTRHRTDRQMRALAKERYAPHLQLATEEAKRQQFNRRVVEERAARLAARGLQAPMNPAALRPLVGDRTRALMPPPRLWPPRSGHRPRTSGPTAFYARIAGVDLSAERDGHDRYVRAQRMHRWRNAPEDPLTPEECATVVTKTLVARRAAREAAREAARNRTYRRGHITPVTMTLETALRIADAAARRTGNGTTHR